MQGPLRAFFERVRKKRLGVAHKSDFTGGQAELFPDQTHQPVTLRAAARIAVAAGREDQADVLRGSRIGRNRARDLIGESLHQQRMRRDRRRRDATRVADSLAGASRDRMSQASRCNRLKSSAAGSTKISLGAVAAIADDKESMEASVTLPARKPRIGSQAEATALASPQFEIGSEDERRRQCSFPPIRPCLVMEASTSTIARTATSAVMSEMS